MELRGWEKVTSEVNPEISYELRPMNIGEYLTVLQTGEESGLIAKGDADPDKKKTAKESFENAQALSEMAQKVFPGCIRNLTGITIMEKGAKRDVTLEEALIDMAFLPLMGEMLNNLVQASTLSQNDEKN